MQITKYYYVIVSTQPYILDNESIRVHVFTIYTSATDFQSTDLNGVEKDVMPLVLLCMTAQPLSQQTLNGRWDWGGCMVNTPGYWSFSQTSRQSEVCKGCHTSTLISRHRWTNVCFQQRGNHSNAHIFYLFLTYMY